jgi:uncharacterized protein YoxC
MPVSEKLQQEWDQLTKDLDLIERQLAKLTNQKNVLKKQGKKKELEDIEKDIAPLGEKKAHLVSLQKKLQNKMGQNPNHK